MPEKVLRKANVESFSVSDFEAGFFVLTGRILISTELPKTKLKISRVLSQW
jgi:hypothetical protein